MSYHTLYPVQSSKYRVSVEEKGKILKQDLPPGTLIYFTELPGTISSLTFNSENGESPPPTAKIIP